MIQIIAGLASDPAGVEHPGIARDRDDAAPRFSTRVRAIRVARHTPTPPARIFGKVIVVSRHPA